MKLNTITAFSPAYLTFYRFDVWGLVFPIPSTSITKCKLIATFYRQCGLTDSPSQSDSRTFITNHAATLAGTHVAISLDQLNATSTPMINNLGSRVDRLMLRFFFLIRYQARTTLQINIEY